VYIGPAVKRVGFVSDKMPDIMLTDQRCSTIARNCSDPTKDKNYESNGCLYMELEQIFDTVSKYHLKG
jgi:hypothetical protein